MTELLSRMVSETGFGMCFDQLSRVERMVIHGASIGGSKQADQTTSAVGSGQQTPYSSHIPKTATDCL